MACVVFLRNAGYGVEWNLSAGKDIWRGAKHYGSTVWRGRNMCAPV